jgi:hypothetical protein
MSLPAAMTSPRVRAGRVQELAYDLANGLAPVTTFRRCHKPRLGLVERQSGFQIARADGFAQQAVWCLQACMPA